MAKGPLASSGNQAQDIAPVQLQGGAQSGPGAAEALLAVSKIAIPALKERRVDEIKEGLSDKTDAIQTALLARANPALQDTMFSKEALQNPATAAAFAQFNDIANAVAQKKLPGQFALERLVVIQNDAIAASPAFEEEIRAAMIAATGADPDKKLFGQLMTDSNVKSQAQKDEEKIQTQMTLTGMTREAIIMGAKAKRQREIDQDLFASRKVNGTLNMQAISKEATATAGEFYGELLLNMQKHRTAGGGFDPSYITDIKIRMSRAKFSAIARIQAVVGGTIDPADLTAALVPIEMMERNLIQIMDDGNLAVLTADTIGLNKSIYEGKFMQESPDAAVLAVFGKEAFIAAKQYYNTHSDPAMRSLQDKLDPNAAAATDVVNTTSGVRQFAMPSSATIAAQFAKMGDNDFERLSAVDKTARRIAANIALQTPGTKEEGVRQALATLQGDYAWRAFNNDKVASATRTDPIRAKRLVSLQTNQTGGLAVEYTALTQLEGFSAGRFGLDGGKLVYKRTAVAAKDWTDADKEAGDFVDRFNTAATISAKYQGIGVLPDSKFGGINQYFSTIQSAVEKVLKSGGKTPAAKPKANTEVVFGDDGKLTFKG